MKAWIVALLLGLLAIPCLADPLAGASPEVRKMIAHEEFLNDKCRGGSGDLQSTMNACKQRDKIGKKLYKRGWCYGQENQYEYQKHWEHCQINTTSSR